MFDRLLRFSARLSPLSPAASDGASHLSYAGLDRVVDGVAAALDTAGLRALGKDRVVGIAVANQYLHLVLILACARLGLGTVSLLPQWLPMRALCRAELLIADDAALSPDLLADAEFFAAAGSSAAHPPHVTTDPEALARVQLSSGTTGQPKAVGMSWALMERRIRNCWERAEGFDRLISLVGVESGSLPLYLNCLARGGSLLFVDRDLGRLAASLPHLRPTGILASPVQIRALLDAMPPQAAAIPGLLVALGGAGSARTLQREVALKLGQVVLHYASTEAGVVAIGLGAGMPGDTAAGYVAPWVELEIVDEADAPVPPDVPGRVRVRGGDVVTGYLTPAPDDAQRFREAWFYTGDIGRIGADGLVSIDGREDEVMNFGGQKFLPGVLEGPVRGVAGVHDVAAFALEDASGIAQPWLAIVRDDGAEIDPAALSRALAIPELPPVQYAWFDVIPRTALGKVQREPLRDAARRLVASA